MRPLRLDGAPDAQRLAMLRQTLTNLGIRPDSMLTEHPILIDRITYEASLGWPGMGYDIKQTHIVHVPDITILGKNGIACIVELDGSIHDTRSGRRKTERRDRDYADARIPHIALNMADLEELGDTWADYLRAALVRRGILQPADQESGPKPAAPGQTS